MLFCKPSKSIVHSFNVIAVDFDGTITDDTPYPQVGEIRPEAKKYIKKLYEHGFKLVLWTARNKKDYKFALRQLEDADLLQYFDFEYNHCGATGKLLADYYIDDKACTKLDWRKTYKHIIRGKYL